jgi:hypothetical protein
LRAFADRHGANLSPEAQGALNRFLGENKDYFKENWRAGWQGIKRVAPAVASVRSEVGFHLADFGAAARRLSERAFLHLQRIIVVDDTVRSKWKSAFENGEVACERLGAVHLLFHGIWAFKVAAAGERTDLVFADRPLAAPEVEGVAEALVLTEWKKVTSADELDAKAEQARAQAARYSSGTLAGIELASYRYVVLVSERHLHPPPDVPDAGIVYRHINIAVDPITPSRS